MDPSTSLMDGSRFEVEPVERLGVACTDEFVRDMCSEAAARRRVAAASLVRSLVDTGGESQRS